MRVKRYVVDSMPDALQKIRSELGKDAVILNTKEIRLGGFLGFFAKKKIEVIAATDTKQASPAPTSAKPTSGSSFGRAAYQIQSAHNNHLGGTQSQGVQASTAVLDEPGLFKNINVPDPLTAPEAQPAQEQASAAFDAQVPSTRDQMLLDEIKQMKEMMARLTFEGSAVPALPVAFQTVKQHLLHHEIDAAFADELISKALEALNESETEVTEALVKNAVRLQLSELFAERGNSGVSAQSKVAHFVGPTGVGKTTTIAKLAAEQVLKKGRKVGFITSDTYRIAAVDQLRTYANILNVPLEVVFSSHDLAKAFQNLEGCDIIFMDTAGRNFRNELYVSELNSLLQSRGETETYLVLSLTAKYKDLKVITDNFNKFKLDKVLFTKADETDTYGSIVNLIHDFPLQLSYWTNGQNVPDDIGLISQEKVLNLLLGAEHDE